MFGFSRTAMVTQFRYSTLLAHTQVKSTSLRVHVFRCVAPHNSFTGIQSFGLLRSRHPLPCIIAAEYLKQLYVNVNLDCFTHLN